MPNAIQKVISRAIQSHITRRVVDNLFDAKVVLGASIALDTCQNLMDYVEISKNKKLNDNNKKYLQAYKLTNAIIEGAVQIGAGALLLSEKTQNFLIKISQKLFKLPPHINECSRNNFRILSVLIGCVILAKRIVAPLLVTPLTAMTRDHLCKNEKNKEKTSCLNRIS